LHQVTDQKTHCALSENWLVNLASRKSVSEMS
jgi:hypothetical protein